MKQLSAILLSVAALFASRAADDVIIADGVEYTWSATHLGYVVTGWDQETPIQELHIRGIVGDDLDVVGIAADAFNPANYLDDDEQTLLPPFQGIEIDEGINFIGSNAFIDCASVKWIKTPSTLTTIGSGAFIRCYALEYALLSEGLATIGEEAFAFCTGLTMMAIPSTVTDIQAHAFSGCAGVTDVYFLMTDEEQLDSFNWWDGVYEPGNEEHGGMEFNTNQHTVIHVPQGMLQDYVDSQKFVAWMPLVEDDGCYPLWWIVNYGVEGRSYTVADDLTAVYVDKKGGLYAKDDNHWLTPDLVLPDEIDYVQSVGLMSHDYDQSNWVMIEGLSTTQIVELENHVIQGKSLSGTLTDKRNPVISIAGDCQPVGGDQSDYQPNVYIPCSFMGYRQTSIAPLETDEFPAPTFAFVRPKPQEYIKVDRCIYSADHNAFFISQPDPQADTNLHGLRGGFQVDYSLYQYENIPELTDGGFYRFNAINRLTVVQEENRDEELITYEPYVDGGYSTNFTVFPLYLPNAPIVTAVTPVADHIKKTKNGWHSVDGRFWGTETPTVKGLYINNGKKVIVK